MAYDIRIDNRNARAEIIGQEEDHYKIRVDGQVYEVDMKEVANGIYSVLLNGRSYNIEMNPGQSFKQYTIDTRNHQYEVEIVDAETKYRRSREQGSISEDEDVITSPVPGKVIDVAAKPGMEVEKGQTLVVVSAMKMESEFKASKNGVIKEVKVEEGQNVDAQQVLVVTE